MGCAPRPSVAQSSCRRGRTRRDVLPGYRWSSRAASGVARPHATGALAWGVVMKPFVTVAYLHYLVLFITIASAVGLGRGSWLATLLRAAEAVTELRAAATLHWPPHPHTLDFAGPSAAASLTRPCPSSSNHRHLPRPCTQQQRLPPPGLAGWHPKNKSQHPQLPILSLSRAQQSAKGIRFRGVIAISKINPVWGPFPVESVKGASSTVTVLSHRS
jgi:hypothetical protein